MSKLKSGKVAIIGCGFVGSASAFADAERIIYRDGAFGCKPSESRRGSRRYRTRNSVWKTMQIYAGDYDDIADAAIIVNYSRCKSEAGRNTAGSGKQKHCNFPVDYSGNYKKRF